MKRLALILSASLLLVLALPGLAFAQDEAPTAAELSLAMDTVWVLVAAVLVIFMQAGFAMLEVGFSRMKNVGSVVAKILVNVAIAALMFWAVGFAFTFSDGGGLQSIIGLNGFFLSGSAETYAGLSWSQVPVSAKFVFQVAFVAVSLAIVWGTMLERTKFAVYVIFAVVFAGLIYPLVAHWVWGGGWLAELGKQDFAGSTVVHLSGAAAALAGTLLLGPRLGKYDDEGRPVTIPGHNMPLAVLGVLILWVGWYGFNPGSTMAATTQIADVALTTTLAAAAGVLGAMTMSYFYRRNVDVGMGGNGAIAALVAITASCAFVAPWASIIIGFVAGIIMYLVLMFVDRIGVDDPLGAIAAHGMGGVWGTLSCGLFTTPELAAVGQPGLFYGGGFTQLGVQALGIIACGGFVFLSSLLVFAILKATIGIRVSPEQELDGLDIHEHGVYGYPDLVATDPQGANGTSPRGAVSSGRPAESAT
ncbi:amt: ammonium transporter [Rubrobacter radiotolerans]|uniref:Ammonium transporter n=1 Tax=Rubrobacter radiotolerans TaxID=42256 RepID=A0A023X531_RUBRA|nr:ammonium transporter [Rubrobacter radiotolerans]AHY47080.1 amt: ammonium transporter [Rubrobacter radiotolerans]MDX5894485.1 ammonium transporter [Rubrobacter radiotolerans]SMC06102.1 ammonium transporter, Amt family [Rubrobacter radiotolerans DSM 5868]